MPCRRLGLPDDASFDEVIDAKTFLAEVRAPATTAPAFLPLTFERRLPARAAPRASHKQPRHHTYVRPPCDWTRLGGDTAPEILRYSAGEAGLLTGATDNSLTCHRGLIYLIIIIHGRTCC